jgi:hypothetical protein
MLIIELALFFADHDLQDMIVAISSRAHHDRPDHARPPS